MSERLSCQWAGENLELLGDRAVYWPRKETLIIADPHFGKPSAYRNAGIPVPIGTTADDLLRLNNILLSTAAKRLVVLGDFFHHRTGQCDHTMTALAQWRRSSTGLEVLIVMGNHDRSSDPPPLEWNVDYQRNPVEDGPFLFCHEPCRKANLFVLSGHIHPAVTLRDTIGPPLRVPCFLFSEDHALLPAFGGFTGTATVRPQPGDQVYGIANGSVIRIPSQARRPERTGRETKISIKFRKT